jgi:hypothetical protein
MQTPWAILLTRFSDNDAEPYPRSRYDEIFTTAGAGKWNMVDYFRDMSHGKLDLSGSQVFGWYTLDKVTSEYAGSGANPAGRQELVQWAKDKATAEGVNLGNFHNVVVVLNSGLDLFGGGNGVVCGDDGANRALSGLSPSFLGQEMGHGYGLNHSRREGSTLDYTDPFDVMSVDAGRSAPHPIYTDRDPFGQPVFEIGPGLNAANMWSKGWLDMTRVWTDPGSSRISTTVQLRPLHSRELPGYLAAKFGEYFIEFRMNTGWDALVPSCVLVHRFESGQSYLVPDEDGNDTFGEGSGISTPDNLSVLGSFFGIRVKSIDTANQVATISLARAPAQIPRQFPQEGPFQTPWIKWLEAASLGEAVVVLDGKAVTIPKNSPAYRILENVAMIGNSSPLMSEQLQTSIREEALSNIAKLSQTEVQAPVFRAPAISLNRRTGGGFNNGPS